MSSSFSSFHSPHPLFVAASAPPPSPPSGGGCAAPLLPRGGGGGLRSGIDGFFIRWVSNPCFRASWCCSSAWEIDRTISVGAPRAVITCWCSIEEWDWMVTGAVSFQKKKILDFIHFEFSTLLPVFRNSSSQNQKKPVHVWNESSLPLPSPFAAFLLKKIIVVRKA